MHNRGIRNFGVVECECPKLVQIREMPKPLVRDLCISQY